MAALALEFEKLAFQVLAALKVVDASMASEDSQMGVAVCDGGIDILQCRVGELPALAFSRLELAERCLQQLKTVREERSERGQRPESACLLDAERFGSDQSEGPASPIRSRRGSSLGRSGRFESAALGVPSRRPS